MNILTFEIPSVMHETDPTCIQTQHIQITLERSYYFDSIASSKYRVVCPEFSKKRETARTIEEKVSRKGNFNSRDKNMYAFKGKRRVNLNKIYLIRNLGNAFHCEQQPLQIRRDFILVILILFLQFRMNSNNFLEVGFINTTC